MPFTLSDTSAGVQVLGASNSGGVEFGNSTPSSTLTVNGHSLVSGSSLAPQTVPSNGLSRVTGQVTLTATQTTDVSVGSTAGFGTVSGAFLLSFNGDGTMTVAYGSSSGSSAFNYSVF